jgi:hypothetical protein
MISIFNLSTWVERRGQAMPTSMEEWDAAIPELNEWLLGFRQIGSQVTDKDGRTFM